MKRPLFEAAVALMLGELCAVHKEVLILCILCVFVHLLQRYLQNREAGRCLSELMLLLAFFLLGDTRLTKQLEIYRSYEIVAEHTPVKVTGKIQNIQKKSEQVQLDLLVEEFLLENSGEYLSDRVTVRVVLEPDVDWKVGQTIEVSGGYDPLDKKRNIGNFDEQQYYYGEGIVAKVQGTSVKMTDISENLLKEYLSKLRAELCQNIDDVCKTEEASVLKAILFGDKSTLDADVKALYQRNGIAHILAISGLHMSLLGMGVYHFLRRRCSFVTAGVTSIVLLCLFGCMAGFVLSVKRALCMMVVRIGADITGRTYDGMTAIGLSVLVVLWLNPYGIFSAAFLLSYSAVCSVSILSPMLEQWLWGKKRKGKKIQRTLLSNVVIWVLQLPVLAGLFFQIPVYSLVLNLIVVPLLSLLFASGMAAALVALAWKGAAVFACGAGVSVIRVYNLLCRWAEELPGAYVITGIPALPRCVLFYFMVAGMVLLVTQKKMAAAGMQKKWIVLTIWLGILTGSILIPEHRRGLEVSVLDVGQGDCTLIQSADGGNFLIDGGSSSEKRVARYRIVPCLKAKGVSKLDYVMISHADSDHISGIKEMLQENMFQIEHLVLPDVTEYKEEYQELEILAKSRGTRVIYLKAQDKLRQGELEFEVLHPGTAICKDMNDASMVLYMTYGEFTMCFTGDISSQIEEQLLHIWSDVDVLKVAHHGSKYSSSETFLQNVTAEVVTISCGAENRYGHPHEETLERLATVGAKAYITSKCGEIDIFVLQKQEEYQVRSLLNE